MTIDLQRGAHCLRVSLQVASFLRIRHGECIILDMLAVYSHKVCPLKYLDGTKGAAL